jgi:hypothetical protein
MSNGQLAIFNERYKERLFLSGCAKWVGTGVLIPAGEGACFI